MTQNNGRRIERVIAFLACERAQSKPDNTVVLSVISGSSVLALSKVPAAETALAGLVRLFF